MLSAQKSCYRHRVSSASVPLVPLVPVLSVGRISLLRLEILLRRGREGGDKKRQNIHVGREGRKP